MRVASNIKYLVKCSDRLCMRNRLWKFASNIAICSHWVGAIRLCKSGWTWGRFSISKTSRASIWSIPNIWWIPWITRHCFRSIGNRLLKISWGSQILLLTSALPISTHKSPRRIWVARQIIDHWSIVGLHTLEQHPMTEQSPISISNAKFAGQFHQ